MDPTDPTAQLHRYETYLLDDPQNTALLAEAFDAALAAGRHEQAEFHLRHALALGQDGLDWHRRETLLLMARHRWGEAIEGLERLRTRLTHGDPGHAALSHDVALAHWRRGDAVTALSVLSPWMPPDGRATVAASAPLQALGLRLMHHTGRLDQAFAWATRAEAAGHLTQEAAGVASLVALDLGQLAACRRWAAAAQGPGAPCTEALVSAASLSLLDQDPTGARERLRLALRRQPHDGRQIFTGLKVIGC